MRPTTWLRAPALALALCSPALAAAPIAYTNPDGVNATPVSVATPLPVTCPTCSGSAGSNTQANATAPSATEGQTGVPLSLDLSSNLRVVFANTSIGASQSGAWNISNISGTISLPTGAATSANQSTEITDLAQLHTDLTAPPAPTAWANMNANQVSVGTTATLVVAARTGRGMVTVSQIGTSDIYCGPTSGVTASTGEIVPGTKGASYTEAYTGAVYCITASGTDTVSFVENY